MGWTIQKLGTQQDSKTVLNKQQLKRGQSEIQLLMTSENWVYNSGKWEPKQAIQSRNTGVKHRSNPLVWLIRQPCQVSHHASRRFYSNQRPTSHAGTQFRVPHGKRRLNWDARWVTRQGTVTRYSFLCLLIGLE